MKKVLKSESEMIEFGEKIAKNLDGVNVVELVGDVGAGKTTITKGIAKGLGVEDEITSPTFTLSKRYVGKDKSLIHYDFYRLNDPGIMSEDLEESMSDKNAVVVIEWGESVRDLLPEKHKTYVIKINEDGTREIEEK